MLWPNQRLKHQKRINRNGDKAKERERHNIRKTECQKDRMSKRQNVKKTECQKDRMTKRQNDKKTE